MFNSTAKGSQGGHLVSSRNFIPAPLFSMAVWGKKNYRKKIDHQKCMLLMN